ncbi:MAG: hypothetical protein Q8M65_09425 [Rhodoglobus sp.]|nr:hypothetical protein [Rhodoglobus sp.]
MTVGMILLVPLVYLVLTMSAIQSGSLAAEGAARQAARVFVQSGTLTDASAAAARALEFALVDYGFEPRGAELVVSCRPRPDACLTRQGYVTVTVDLLIDLPLAPSVLTGEFPLAIPLTATATQQVSRFWSGP